MLPNLIFLVCNISNKILVLKDIRVKIWKVKLLVGGKTVSYDSCFILDTDVYWSNIMDADAKPCSRNMSEKV